MDRLNLTSYQKVNQSFNRTMVYHMGVDCGFFVEMNYMVNAMLYCLAHRIRFQLYSDDANFGTGVGWTEYFLPFCEEVHEPFHQKYNFHRLPSWHRILELCKSQRSLGPVAWKVKKTLKTWIGRIVAYRTYGKHILLAQDVPGAPEQSYHVPELGINGDYISTFALLAHMNWQLNPEMQRQKNTCKMALSLPSTFAGAQIRGGDKITETRLVNGTAIIKKLGLPDRDSLFILTDDYGQFLKAKEDFPALRLFTLCQEDETGYQHKQFCQKDSLSKRNAISRLHAYPPRPGEPPTPRKTSCRRYCGPSICPAPRYPRETSQGGESTSKKSPQRILRPQIKQISHIQQGKLIRGPSFFSSGLKVIASSTNTART